MHYPMFLCNFIPRKLFKDVVDPAFKRSWASNVLAATAPEFMDLDLIKEDTRITTNHTLPDHPSFFFVFDDEAEEENDPH